MTIREMTRRAQAHARDKGFVTEGDIRIDQKLMLTVGELVEAQNELRAGKSPNEVYHNAPEIAERESTEDYVKRVVAAKPEGFLIELADAVIRIAQLAEHIGEVHGGGFDLQDAIELKMAYNETRQPMHGGKRF